MENAVEAIKMAFAVMVFVMALSVSMFAFNKAKATSDVVLYAQDETNYYDYEGVSGKAAENRIVGIETIIPTLYKYYKENYTVLFREGFGYNEQEGTFNKVEPLEVYITKSRAKSNTSAGPVQLWGKNYDDIMKNKYSKFFPDGYTESLSNQIFSFDLEEETLRHEPWTGTYVKARENLNCFLNGDKYLNPNNGDEYINYSDLPLQTGGFIGKYANEKFVETVGEYSYNSSQTDSTEDGSSINSLVKEKKKRVIIFTLIN